MAQIFSSLLLWSFSPSNLNSNGIASVKVLNATGYGGSGNTNNSGGVAPAIG